MTTYYSDEQALYFLNNIEEVKEQLKTKGKTFEDLDGDFLRLLINKKPSFVENLNKLFVEENLINNLVLNKDFVFYLINLDKQPYLLTLSDLESIHFILKDNKIFLNFLNTNEMLNDQKIRHFIKKDNTYNSNFLFELMSSYPEKVKPSHFILFNNYDYLNLDTFSLMLQTFKNNPNDLIKLEEVIKDNITQNISYLKLCYETLGENKNVLNYYYVLDHILDHHRPVVIERLPKDFIDENFVFNLIDRYEDYFYEKEFLSFALKRGMENKTIDVNQDFLLQLIKNDFSNATVSILAIEDLEYENIFQKLLGDKKYQSLNFNELRQKAIEKSPKVVKYITCSSVELFEFAKLICDNFDCSFPDFDDYEKDVAKTLLKSYPKIIGHKNAEEYFTKEEIIQVIKENPHIVIVNHDNKKELTHHHFIKEIIQQDLSYFNQLIEQNKIFDKAVKKTKWKGREYFQKHLFDYVEEMLLDDNYCKKQNTKEVEKAMDFLIKVDPKFSELMKENNSKSINMSKKEYIAKSDISSLIDDLLQNKNKNYKQLLNK